MSKFREVPKSLAPNVNQSAEEISLASPAELFGEEAAAGFEIADPNTELTSPDALFDGLELPEEIKLKSPQELFKKVNLPVKPGSNGDKKVLTVNKDIKKSGK